MLILLICYLVIGVVISTYALLGHMSKSHEPYKWLDILVFLPMCFVIYACVWPWAIYFDFCQVREG